MDEVSETVGEVDSVDERREDTREDMPLGGLKISLASSSWCIPSSDAALCAAAGLINLSDIRVDPVWDKWINHSLINIQTLIN